MAWLWKATDLGDIFDHQILSSNLRKIRSNKWIFQRHNVKNISAGTNDKVWWPLRRPTAVRLSGCSWDDGRARRSSRHKLTSCCSPNSRWGVRFVFCQSLSSALTRTELSGKKGSKYEWFRFGYNTWTSCRAHYLKKAVWLLLEIMPKYASTAPVCSEMPNSRLVSSLLTVCPPWLTDQNLQKLAYVLVAMVVGILQLGGFTKGETLLVGST